MPVFEFAFVPLGYCRLACMYVMRQSSQGFWALRFTKVCMPLFVDALGAMYGP